MNRKEIRRQSVHFSGVLTAILAYYLGGFIVGLGALTLSMGILILSLWVERKEKIRNKMPFRVKLFEEIEDTFYKKLNDFEREEDLKERPYNGAFTFFLSIGTVFLVFPFQAAVIATLVLSVSDSLSTLVGVHYGKNSLPYNENKSWQGSITFLISSFLISAYFLSPLMSVLVAIVGTLIESWPKINDNISVPLTVALLITLL
ncbi:MAG: diacylglycerol/polyprenol kinase family protein [Candidatus Aenigmatarchaeota archaeon]